MKILLDARFYGLEHAGLGRYTMNLVHELCKIRSSNDYIILLRQKYFDELTFPKNWKKVKVDAKHYTIREQANLPLIIRKYKPDLTHFLHSNIPIFYSGKFVVTIHDMTMYRQGIDATTLPLPLYFAKRIPFKMVFRKAVYESQTIITPSQAVKDELVSFFKIPENKVVVTYEGVERNKQKTMNNKRSLLLQSKQEKQILARYQLLDTKYFLYVGNAYPHKNMKRAVEAIAGINEERRTKNEELIYFAIISGRGVFRHRLEKQVEKLEAKEYVKVLDFVPDSELSVLYKNSLAFLFPSLSEGFGLPGLEAIDAGTILIASDIPVFREIYKDDAMYFDAKDTGSMVKVMQKTVQMKKVQRDAKIKESKKILKNYSWKKMSEETQGLYLNA